MTPKEKAKELVDKFYNIDSDSEMYDDFTMKIFYAQRCALICVDEVLKEILSTPNVYELDTYYYWIKIKQEINKL